MLKLILLLSSKCCFFRNWGLLNVALVALQVIGNRTSFAQNTYSANPANLNHPHILFTNPATPATAPERGYLGLKFIYPGAISGSAFAVRSTSLAASSRRLLDDKLALGVTVDHFGAPLYNETKVSLLAAKSWNKRFSLGLGIGFVSRNFAVTDFNLVDSNDPVFSGGSSKTSPDIAVGFWGRVSDRLTTGVSLLHINQPNLAIGETKFTQSLEAYLGLQFDARFAGIDLGAHLWQHEWHPLLNFEFPASASNKLRLGYSISNAQFGGQAAVLEKGAIAYQYSLPTNEISMVSAGSHEFGLLYDFVENQGDIAGDFQVVLVPSVATVYPNDSTQVMVSIENSDIDDRRPVTIEVANEARDLNARLSQRQLSNQEPAQIVIQAGTTAMIGSHRLRLTARAGERVREIELPVVVTARPPLSARLSATVDTVVIRESRRIREELPVIPMVFFGRNSAELQESRYDLFSSAKLDRSDRFADVNEINSAYRNILNIIAERLRSAPAAKVTVRGYSPGNPVEVGGEHLALRRAQSVSQHLTSNLRVDPRQVSTSVGLVESQETAKRDSLRLEELQAAEISVSAEHEELLLGPIVSRRNEIDASPSQCGFVVEDLQSGLGIRSWSLVLMSNTDTVDVVTGYSTPPDTIWWGWNFDPKRHTDFWRQLQYALVLTDNSDLRFRTPWQSISSFRMADEITQVEKIPLFLFSFDRAEVDYQAPRLQNKLRQIAAKLKSDSQTRCVLHGHTDAIGETAHNQRLSVERAINVMTELIKLGVPKSRIAFYGYGESHPLADNRLPEGRMLNRRVEVYLNTSNE